MDAQVSYAFHSERKQNPEKFKNQLVNQVPMHNSILLSGYEFSYTFQCDKKMELLNLVFFWLGQSTYAKLGCTQGWFAASVFHPSSK